MQAIPGFYENGTVTLDRQAPVHKGNIIILFPEADIRTKSKMSDEEAIGLFHKFTGSINRTIDFEKERAEYLNEKYGFVD